MQTIQVIFGRSNWKLISVGIQLRTFCWWSHVGGIMPDGRIVESVGGQGVVITELADFKARYSDTQVRKVTCLNSEMAYEILNKHIGSRYDDHAFWGVFFSLGWDDLEAWQCAELLGAAMGIFNDKKLATLTPKDILKVSHDIR
jgi:uncharacterized protein YycO